MNINLNKKTLSLVIGGIALFAIGVGVGTYVLAPHPKQPKIFRCNDCKNRGSEYSCKQCRQISWNGEHDRAPEFRPNHDLHSGQVPAKFKSEPRPQKGCPGKCPGGCSNQPQEMRNPPQQPSAPAGKVLPRSATQPVIIGKPAGLPAPQPMAPQKAQPDNAKSK